jgi:hypothetical protein
MHTVELKEAEERLAELIDEVASGEERDTALLASPLALDFHAPGRAPGAHRRDGGRKYPGGVASGGPVIAG